MFGFGRLGFRDVAAVSRVPPHVRCVCPLSYRLLGFNDVSEPPIA